MSNRIKLEILTPDGAIFAREVDEVILPGTSGELGILPGHLPLMTTLKSGQLVGIEGGQKHFFAVHSGFAEILPNEIIVLTEAAEGADEIDIDRAREALARAEEAMKAVIGPLGEDDAHVSAAEQHAIALERARARLFVAEEKK